MFKLRLHRNQPSPTPPPSPTKKLIDELVGHDISISPHIESHYDQIPTHGFKITFRPRFVNSRGQFNEYLGKLVASRFNHRFNYWGWHYYDGKFTRFVRFIPEWSMVLEEVTELQQCVTELMDKATEWQELKDAVMEYRARGGVENVGA